MTTTETPNTNAEGMKYVEKGPASLSEFRQQYLDYREGNRDAPPSTDGLEAAEQRAADALIQLLDEVAGVDPRASGPSIEQLLARWQREPIVAPVPAAADPQAAAMPLAEIRRERLQRVVPLQKATTRGWLPRGELDDVEAAACDLLEVDDLGDDPPFAVAARRSNHKEPMSAEQKAWLGRVRQIARQRTVPKYEPRKLEAVAARLPSILQDGPRAIPRAVELLAEAGVRVVFCEGLPGGRLAGAVTLMPDGGPVIGLTTRGDRFDGVAFTLLHECAHLVRGHIGPDSPPLLDDESHARDQDDPREIEANELASKWLFPNGLDLAAAFDDVDAAAHRLRVHPSCVAGRIQHESGDWKMLREHRCKVRDDLKELGLLAN